MYMFKERDDMEHISTGKFRLYYFLFNFSGFHIYPLMALALTKILNHFSH